MLKSICDICHRDISKGSIQTTEHYCDQHQPFAQAYKERTAAVIADCISMMERRLEQTRKEYLREISTPKLEAVK